MKTTISTRKIEIYINESDKNLKKDFYKLIRDYSYFTFRHANEIVQHNFMMHIIKNGIGNSKNSLTQEEIFDKLGEIFGCKTMSVPYKFSKQEFRDKLPSNIRVAVSNTINKLFDKEKRDVLCGKRSIRTYKNGMPVPFTAKSITNLKWNDISKNFTFSLFGIPFQTRLGRDRSNNKSIIDNIINGTYKLSDSSFQIKDNKVFLLLTFKLPIIDYDLDINKVLGIDLGINVPICAAINNSKDKLSLGSRESFLNQRLKFQRRRKILQRDLKLVSGGKGRNKKMAALDRLSESERNFVKTYNHLLSKEVVAFAIKNKCGTINIEDLSGINTNEFLLRNWSYYELQNMIQYKAKKNNIVVNLINPKYTSQRCSNCGHIDKDNRKTQEDFECVSCGHKDFADYNAAKNISIAHTNEFEKEIQKYTSSLELCES